MSELDSPLRAGTEPRAGTDPSGSGVSGDGLGDGLAAAGAGAVTATVSSAAGGVHFAEVTMLAVAVSVTELTELALDATGTWACRLTGCLSVTELTVQTAVLSPLAQPLVYVGFWLAGLDESVTDTSGAGPFSVETSTTNAASCPRLMLDSPRWTLTHSSGAVVVALAPVLALELAVVLELALALALGLVARRASRDAEAVASADHELTDDGAGEDGAAVDGAAVDGAADDEAADSDGEGDSEDDPAGDGSAAGLEAAADGDADADGEGEGEGEGDGDGDGEGEGVGEGDGDGVLEDGSSWQLVSVLAAAVVVTSLTGLAWAMPDEAASMLTIRKPPASKLSVVARTCAKRMRLPCLDCSLRLRCVLHGFGVN
jgi:hypothetical protein